MSADIDDIRQVFDPMASVPASFWEAINMGQKDPHILAGVLRTLSREDLVRFDRELRDLATCFCHAPFVPPDFEGNSDWLTSVAQWVISQGPDPFFQVWDNPTLFWQLVEDDSLSTQSSFEGIAYQIWREQYEDEMPM
jgi:hypothetical protein